MEVNNKDNMTLSNWIWKSYFKAAILPLILLELFFIFIFFSSNYWTKKTMITSLTTEVTEKLSHLIDMQTDIINTSLTNLSYSTESYRKHTLKALQKNIPLNEEDLKRLVLSKDGVYYTNSDKENKGVAIFYSGVFPIKEKEKQKVANLLSTETIMKNTLEDNPLIASVYFNTFDSLNIIYPYFDVIKQYTPLMNIPEFNFYYEADLIHNPKKKVVWTDAYVDPAGHGWMASSIAPVYNKGFLEGVVGIDVTIEIMTDNLLNLNIPWGGYGILLGKDGTILALPKLGEQDFNITELKHYTYKEAIKQDTFKPDNFNMFKMKDMTQIVKKLKDKNSGLENVILNNTKKIIAWKTIPQTGWKFLVIIPEKKVYENVYIASKNLLELGLFTLIGSSLFCLIFFVAMNNKAKKMAGTISAPLLEINEIIKEFGNENYSHKLPNFHVIELQETAKKIIELGNELSSRTISRDIAQNELLKYQSSLEEIIALRTKNLVDSNTSLENKNYQLKVLQSQMIHQEKLASIGQLGAGIAHEINNPMSFVNSNLYTLNQYYDILLKYTKMHEKALEITDEKEMQLCKKELLKFKNINQINFIIEDFSDVFEESKVGINRIIEIVNNLKNFSNLESSNNLSVCNFNDLITCTLGVLRNEYNPNIQINLSLNSENTLECNNSDIKQVLLNLIMNSIFSIKEKYPEKGGIIDIETFDKDKYILCKIKDNGKGVPEEIKESIFNPFFTTKAPGLGTGLGLYITYDVIVNKHHGTVEFTSELDKFTEFTLTLPNYHSINS